MKTKNRQLEKKVAKNKFEYKKEVLVISSLALVTCLVFRWVPFTYFQQDEWYFMGQYLLAKTDPMILFRVFSGMHFLPVEQLILFTQYHLFWTNPIGYGIVSVLTHVVVVVLFYIILRMLRVRVIPAIFGTLFFSLNPTSSQVVSWSPASASGAASVLFFLVGCILWLKNNQKSFPLYLRLLMILFFIASLFTKVDILVGFLFLIFVPFFLGFRKKVSFKLIIVSLFIWFSLFVLAWSIGKKDNEARAANTLSDIIPYLISIFGWMGNIIITHNSLQIVIRNFFGQYASYILPANNDQLSRIISSVLGSLWYIGFFLVAISKKISLKRIIIFPVFVGISMLPYFFSITRGLESRHFYIPVLFTGMWIAFFLDWLIEHKSRRMQKIFLFFFIILLSFFVFANQPSSEYMLSHEKREKISSALEQSASLSPGTIVYFLKNGAGTPFQSGIGQMLLVFQAHGDLSFVPYFRSSYPYNAYFLYGMFEQGYEKLGNKGFGYYFDKDTLLKDYQKGLFDKQSIRALEYNVSNSSIVDITEAYLKEFP